QVKRNHTRPVILSDEGGCRLTDQVAAFLDSRVEHLMLDVNFGVFLGTNRRSILVFVREMKGSPDTPLAFIVCDKFDFLRRDPLEKWRRAMRVDGENFFTVIVLAMNEGDEQTILGST